MAKNIEARLAKIERQLKDIEGKHNQEQWAFDVVLGLKATILKEEPTEQQAKALGEWAEKKAKPQIEEQGTNDKQAFNELYE